MQSPGDLRLLTADRLECCAGFRGEEQAGDLVLVLVGEQLVEVHGDGAGERVGAGDGRVFGGLCPLDEAGEAVGNSLRLVTDEVGAQAGDELTGAFHVRHWLESGRVVHRSPVGDPPAPPGERVQVALDSHTVERDRLLDGGGCDRDRSRLHRDPEEEHVGRGGVAEQRGGQRRGVHVAVVLGP